MSRTKYSLTEEHRAYLQPWANMWIANAMSTKPMDEADREAMRVAVRGLYSAAGMEPPPDHRIVFVASPFVLRFAGGCAAAIWHLRKHATEASGDPRLATGGSLSLGGKGWSMAAAANKSVSSGLYAATDYTTRKAAQDVIRTAVSATRDATSKATEEATIEASSIDDDATNVAIAASEEVNHATQNAIFDASFYGALAATEPSTFVRVHKATSDDVGDAIERTITATQDAVNHACALAATNQVVDDAIVAATILDAESATIDAVTTDTHFAVDGAICSTVDPKVDSVFDVANEAVACVADDPALDAALEVWFYGHAGYVEAVGRIMGLHRHFGLPCAQMAWNMWQGGNQWSAWTAYLSFFRHIVKLPLDYVKWEHWESATVHGGPRIMHTDFCMISDRPEILTVDDQHRPHAVDGPFCQWRDGTRLYCWHGVRIPAKYYLRPHTAREILAEPNAEVRRAMMERYEHFHGAGSFIADAGAVVIDSAIQPMRRGEAEAINELLSIDLPDDPDGRMLAVRVIDPSTGRAYVIRVHPRLCPMLADNTVGEPQRLTVTNAIASTFGLRGEEYLLQQES